MGEAVDREAKAGLGLAHAQLDEAWCEECVYPEEGGDNEEASNKNCDDAIVAAKLGVGNGDFSFFIVVIFLLVVDPAWNEVNRGKTDKCYETREENECSRVAQIAMDERSDERARKQAKGPRHIIVTHILINLVFEFDGDNRRNRCHRCRFGRPFDHPRDEVEPPVPPHIIHLVEKTKADRDRTFDCDCQYQRVFSAERAQIVANYGRANGKRDLPPRHH